MYAYRRATEEQEWISAQHSHPNDSADFQGIYKKKRKKEKCCLLFPSRRRRAPTSRRLLHNLPQEEDGSR